MHAVKISSPFLANLVRPSYSLRVLSSEHKEQESNNLRIAW